LSPFVVCFLLQTGIPKAVWGQTPDPDAEVQPLEPDFTLVNLPTTLRLPKYKSDFFLTHRFQGNLRDGSFDYQLSNLFGLDNGASIGFGYRFGIARHLQLAAYRTNIDRETEFYAKYDPVAQSGAMPVAISGLLSMEGANNFRRDYTPAIGAVISRKIGDLAALYAVPMFAHNTAIGATTRETSYVGLGARVRVRPAIYLVGEVSPRLGGYAPGQPEYSFGFEGRVGGHVFQLNFSNTVGTTFKQIALGGRENSLFLGFNLARKFY
jgi:hypothetical protein